MMRIGRQVDTMCGQTAESFDLAEGGTTVLLNGFAFSQSYLSCSHDAASLETAVRPT